MSLRHARGDHWHDFKPFVSYLNVVSGMNCSEKYKVLITFAWYGAIQPLRHLALYEAIIPFCLYQSSNVTSAWPAWCKTTVYNNTILSKARPHKTYPASHLDALITQRQKKISCSYNCLVFTKFLVKISHRATE